MIYAQITCNIIQIVTGAEVNIEHFFCEIRKMLPRGRRPKATFYKLEEKIQCWSMTPVTICFVIS